MQVKETFSAIREGFARRRMFYWMVVIPFFVFAAYLYLWSAPRWVSDAKLTVKSAGAADPASGMAMLLGDPTGALKDGVFLREFIHSPAMLDQLEADIGLSERYREGVDDPFSRLAAGATREERFAYFKSHVGVILDETSGVIALSTEGFSPADAKLINEAVIARSDAFLNGMSHKVAQDQVAFLESQIDATMKRATDAKRAIIEFQAKNKILDPVRQAEAGAKLVGELSVQLAQQETELTNLALYMQDQSPAVASVKGRIAALRAQIERERAKLVAGDDTALNTMGGSFHDLQVQAEIAMQIYKTALGALERERIDSVRRFKSLVVMSPSTLPEEATVPNRPYRLIVFLLVALSLYGVARLVQSSIEEHRS